jgi:NAD(P)-dependent dehydrogenase (short-subunit alcohol dehydrogenase family)
MLLAARGAKVVVNDLALASADAMVAGITAAGGEALAAAAAGSVTDKAAVQAMVAQTLSAIGRIDILVDNVGILHDKSFAKMSADDFRRAVDVHLMGAAICTKAVWDTMRAQQHGRIASRTRRQGCSATSASPMTARPRWRWSAGCRRWRWKVRRPICASTA